MAKSLKEFKQTTINEVQLFDHLKEFVQQNMDNPHVKNGIHQAQLEKAKGVYNSDNHQNKLKS